MKLNNKQTATIISYLDHMKIECLANMPDISFILERINRIIAMLDKHNVQEKEEREEEGQVDGEESGC